MADLHLRRLVKAAKKDIDEAPQSSCDEAVADQTYDGEDHVKTTGTFTEDAEAYSSTDDDEIIKSDQPRLTKLFQRWRAAKRELRFEFDLSIPVISNRKHLCV